MEGGERCNDRDSNVALGLRGIVYLRLALAMHESYLCVIHTRARNSVLYVSFVSGGLWYSILCV